MKLRATYRTGLLSAAIAAGIAFAGGSACAQEKLALRFDFLPYGSHAPFYLAKEKGFFKDNGVEVQMDDGSGGAVAVQLVDGGKYDLAYVSQASAMVARDRGMRLVGIAGVLRKGDLGVLVDEKSPMTKPKDFEGKVIYFSPTSVETLFIDVWFKRNGVDKSKVNLTSLEIGTKVSTYLGGKGDGMFVPIPIYTIRKNIPRLSKGILFDDFGLILPGFGVVTSEDAIAKKPKALAGFVAALQKAWGGIKDRSMIDQAVEAIMKNRPQAKIDPVYIKQQLEAVIPYLDTPSTKDKPLLWQSAEDWDAAIKNAVEAGVIKAGSKSSDFYSNQFVPGNK